MPDATFDQLTEPGHAFALTTRTINGVEYQVYDREPRTLRDAFIATRDHGDALAVVFETEQYTFAQQWTIVASLAAALRDRYQIGRGDRIAIAMRNYPEWVFAFWAAQVLGATVVSLNAWLTAEELGKQLAEIQPRVVFADAERVERLRGLAELIGVRCPEMTGALSYADLLIGADQRELPDCAVEASDPATILFTSGTTGRPKAALSTHFHHSMALTNKLIRAQGKPAVVSDAAAANQARSVKLVIYPLFHISGISSMYTAAYSGHTLVLMYKWNVDAAMSTIVDHSVTEMSGPVFVVRTFLDAVKREGQALPSLRSLGLGGSMVPPDLIADVFATFEGRVSPSTGYGMTESTSGIAGIRGADYVTRPTSVGRALPTVELRVIDDVGQPVAVGVAGELLIRAPQVIDGYLDAPDASALTFRDGWLHTGDIGRLDDDGYLYIEGRRKDVVIRGGENIHCAEVEACLSTHPAVREAAAFGVPDSALGEQLAALVCLRPDTVVGSGELQDYVAQHLARFKVPSLVYFTASALPRTATGKLIKASVRESVRA